MAEDQEDRDVNVNITGLIYNDLKRFAEWLYVVFVVLWIANYIVSGLPLWRDDSDKPGWFGARSAMTVMTDRLTGCQYLGHAGITPRFDAAGQHICRANLRNTIAE